jgi:hypothetical protein
VNPRIRHRQARAENEPETIEEDETAAPEQTAFEW